MQNSDWTSFVTELSYDTIPEPVRAVIRRSFTDTMGVAAIGSTTANATMTAEVAGLLWQAGGAGTSHLLMNGAPASPAGAAFYGAAAIDAIDAHDGSSPCQGHAGSAVFPSLIAMVEAEAHRGHAVDGQRLMTLLVAAYELSYRVGRAQHATVPDYHTSGAWTAVGIAAAGASLLANRSRLDRATHIREAAGIAEYHGPRSQMMRCIDHPTMVRDGVCWGAPTGVTAAYLAGTGFTGAPAITIEGEDAAEHWADLGSGWRIVDDTHYKAYPVCRWAHASIDAARDLMTENNLRADDIAHVEVKTFHKAVRLAGHAPKTLDEMTYGIVYPLATAIVRGQLGLEELRPDVLHDRAIQAMSARITLVEDPHYTKISEGRRWGEVTLALNDGRELNSGPRTPRGDPDMPLSDAEISEKFHLFADPVLGHVRAGQVEQITGAFDDLDADDVCALIRLITQPGLERAASPRVVSVTTAAE